MERLDCKKGVLPRMGNQQRARRIVPVGLILFAVGCGDSSQPTTSVRVDGSSTVYRISQAAADIYGDENPGARVSVSSQGTSAGMQKFLRGEVEICGASRPIQESEIEKAKSAGIDYLEFMVGYDGLAVVVNPQNDWCNTITVEQLKSIWRPEADEKITNWKQVDAAWADVPLELFGPGTASGTFEYFTEAICGEKNASRSDYQKSEDDNMLVHGVAGTKGGLGYFGYAYYELNKDKLKLLAVDSGDGPVKPSPTTVQNLTYEPLSRPLFLYVNRQALERPTVAAFVKFYVTNAPRLAVEAYYVAAPTDAQTKNLELLKSIP